MEFESEIEIRKELAKLLSGETSVDTFQRWFLPRSWNFHRESDSSLKKLVAAVELSLIEFANRDWTEAELRNQFSILLNNYEIQLGQIDPAQVTVKVSAISNALEYHLIALSGDVDIRSVEESASVNHL